MAAMTLTSEGVSSWTEKDHKLISTIRNIHTLINNYYR